MLKPELNPSISMAAAPSGLTFASCIVCLFIIIPIYGQDLSNIESLRKRVDRLQSEVSMKTDSLNSARKELDLAESKALIAKYSGGTPEAFIGAVIRRESKLLKSSDPFSETIMLINEGEVVRLLDYKVSSWLISKGDNSGYLEEGSISETEEIRKFKQALKKRNHDALVNAELEKIVGEQKAREAIMADERKSKEDFERSQVENESERRKSIIAKYGKSLGQKLIDGYYWVGMTAEMARASLGEPGTINKSVGVWGVHEQWVYQSIYLYLEKGKVVSYQNSN